MPALLFQEEMLMVTTDEVWFRYRTHSDKTKAVRVASVRFWPDIQETIFPPLQVPEGKRRVVRCRCGSNDWNEDGRSCGQYIQVFEKKD